MTTVLDNLGFVEASSSLLPSNEKCDFDIYLKIGENFVLFASKDLPISNDHTSRIQKDQITSIYIKSDEEGAYRHYLAQNMCRLAASEQLHRDEKSRLMYDSARSAMTTLFDNPDTPESIVAVKGVTDTIMGNILDDDNAFASLVKVTSYDYYTYTHSINVILYSLGLGKKLGLNFDELQILGHGAALHDIGKSKIPPEVLNKPGKLTQEEFEVIKTHPKKGVEILETLGENDARVLDAVNFHHEKIDGSGYPKGIKGDLIPLSARIVAIVDVFDALNSKRVYKDAMGTFETLKFMKTNMSAHIDAKLLNSFMLCMSGR
jgi:putative nucleotidyltransferase with HDIG domain